MISTRLKNKSPLLWHVPLLDDLNLILVLFHSNPDLLQVLDDEMDAVGLLDALIGDIVDSELLKRRALQRWRDDKDSEGHECVSAIVEVQPKRFLVATTKLLNILVEQQIALHGFAW